MIAIRRLAVARLAAPLALAAVAGCASRSAPRAIILTTDVGVECDDQWALGLLLLLSDAGRIDFRGIVTTHAPSLPAPAAQASARTAREVLDVFAPRSRPPVIAGQNGPIRADQALRGGPGAAFIADASMGFGPDNRLTILATGAVTDIAEAILLDPSIGRRIEIVAMAFDGWPRGGDAWNAKNDVPAYQVVLASDAPLTVAPADVCIRHLVLDAAGAARLAESSSEAGAYLAWKLEDWIAREGDLCRRTTGSLAWPLWDLSVVAHILQMTSWESRPRPGLRDDLTLDHDSSGGEIRWVTAIDREQLWNEIRELLAVSARRGRGR